LAPGLRKEAGIFPGKLGVVPPMVKVVEIRIVGRPQLDLVPQKFQGD